MLGARDDRAVRLGVGLNALGLFLYAGVPVLLGIACRGMFGPLADSQQALPIVLMSLQISQELRNRLRLQLGLQKADTLTLVQKPFRNEELLAAVRLAQESRLPGQMNEI